MKVAAYILATQTRFPPSDFEVPDSHLAGSPRAEPAVLSDSNSPYSAWADKLFPYYCFDTFSLVLVFITWLRTESEFCLAVAGGNFLRTWYNMM